MSETFTFNTKDKIETADLLDKAARLEHGGNEKVKFTLDGRNISLTTKTELKGNERPKWIEVETLINNLNIESNVRTQLKRQFRTNHSGNYTTSDFLELAQMAYRLTHPVEDTGSESDISELSQIPNDLMQELEQAENAGHGPQSNQYNANSPQTGALESAGQNAHGSRTPSSQFDDNSANSIDEEVLRFIKDNPQGGGKQINADTPITDVSEPVEQNQHDLPQSNTDNANQETPTAGGSQLTEEALRIHNLLGSPETPASAESLKLDNIQNKNVSEKGSQKIVYGQSAPNSARNSEQIKHDQVHQSSANVNDGGKKSVTDSKPSKFKEFVSNAGVPTLNRISPNNPDNDNILNIVPLTNYTPSNIFPASPANHIVHATPLNAGWRFIHRGEPVTASPNLITTATVNEPRLIGPRLLTNHNEGNPTAAVRLDPHVGSLAVVATFDEGSAYFIVVENPEERQTSIINDITTLSEALDGVTQLLFISTDDGNALTEDAENVIVDIRTSLAGNSVIADEQSVTVITRTATQDVLFIAPEERLIQVFAEDEIRNNDNFINPLNHPPNHRMTQSGMDNEERWLNDLHDEAIAEQTQFLKKPENFRPLSFIFSEEHTALEQAATRFNEIASAYNDYFGFNDKDNPDHIHYYMPEINASTQTDEIIVRLENETQELQDAILMDVNQQQQQLQGQTNNGPFFDIIETEEPKIIQQANLNENPPELQTDGAQFGNARLSTPINQEQFAVVARYSDGNTYLAVSRHNTSRNEQIANDIIALTGGRTLLSVEIISNHGDQDSYPNSFDEPDTFQALEQIQQTLLRRGQYASLHYTQETFDIAGTITIDPHSVEPGDPDDDF